jgi:hypothetical protein
MGSGTTNLQYGIHGEEYGSDPACPIIGFLAAHSHPFSFIPH